MKTLYFHKPFRVGQEVWDTLTRSKATVIGISYEEGKRAGSNINCVGAWGIWLDNDYAGGGRHPWEVDELTKEATNEDNCS